MIDGRVARRRWAGVVGIVIAMAGLAATICAEQVMPKPPEAEGRAAVSFSIGRLKVGWGSKEEVRPAEVEAGVRRERVRTAGTVLGMIALPLAVVSWARRERAWWGLGVCAFAVAAIAWQTFVIVFAVLLLTGALFVFVSVG